MKLLAVLVYLLVSSLPMLARSSAVHTTGSNIRALDGALTAFNLAVGRYPTQSEGLAALMNPPPGVSTNKWTGSYFHELPKDVWGRDYIYVIPGVHNIGKFDIYSLGEDGISKSGGNDSDDINNWDLERAVSHYKQAAYMERIQPLVYAGAAAFCLLTLVMWKKHLFKGRLRYH